MILMLCSPSEVWKERRGYLRAFERRGESVVFVGPATECEPGMRPDTDIERILERTGTPSLIIHPDGTGFLPHGLERTPVPTACLQIDTHRSLERRMHWAMLFDYAFVFQPGYEAEYRRAGHPRAALHPHAVEADLFADLPQERAYDVGWVGHVGGPPHTRRSRIIPRLANRFRMNDWWREHAPEEMAEVYKSSRIVVDVSRDDYPGAANLRCLEAMAAGTLLVTRGPSELSKLGFEEGCHFVCYRDDGEIESLVDRFLADEEARERIGAAARELVLKEHTYDGRVEEIWDLVERDGGVTLAPARTWGQAAVREVYLDYFSNYDMLDCAFKELAALRRHSRGAALRGARFVLQTLRRRVRSLV